MAGTTSKSAVVSQSAACSAAMWSRTRRCSSSEIGWSVTGKSHSADVVHEKHGHVLAGHPDDRLEEARRQIVKEAAQPELERHSAQRSRCTHRPVAAAVDVLDHVRVSVDPDAFEDGTGLASGVDDDLAVRWLRRGARSTRLHPSRSLCQAHGRPLSLGRVILVRRRRLRTAFGDTSSARGVPAFDAGLGEHLVERSLGRAHQGSVGAEPRRRGSAAGRSGERS